MRANKYISNREHGLLSGFAFIVFGFVLLIFISQVVSLHYSSVSGFSGSTGAHLIAGLHFLTFFIFVALFKTKRFLLSSFLTIFYAIIFIYGLFARYNGARLGGEEFSPQVDFLDKVYRAATEFDFVAAIFISVLLFWQISILLRILIKTLQRKTELL